MSHSRPPASASASISAALPSTATSSQTHGSRARPTTSRPGVAKAQATPAPSRTLKQPMTLHVSERQEEQGKGGRQGGGGQGDAAEYKRALERRAAVARRAEKWIDRAMEEVLGRDVFLKTLTYMHRASYIETQHERHLNGLCAYPLCPHAPAAPYRSGKRFVVSTAQRTVTERDGNDDQAFCSRKCAARGAYVLGQLGTEAPWLAAGPAGITLLDELEDRGAVTWGRGDALIWASSGASSTQVQGIKEGKAVRDKDKETAKEKEEKDKDRLVPLVSASKPAEAGGVHSLLASLAIVERDTSAATATPPTLDEPRLPVAPGPVASAREVSLPQPRPGPVQVASILSKTQTATAPLASPSGPSQTQGDNPKPKTQAQSRRAASSLIATDGAMAASVISASKKINTEVHSDEESDEEEEWAKEMGWGEGPEVDALFAAAREAREMMGGDK